VGQTMLMRGRRRRRAGRSGGKVCGGGGAPEAGEDGVEEEDGEDADVRRSPRGQGRSGRKPPRSGGRWRWTGIAGGDGVGRSVDGGFRETGGGREFWGAEDGGATESVGRG
jgi:hypothetical protein